MAQNRSSTDGCWKNESFMHVEEKEKFGIFKSSIQTMFWDNNGHSLLASSLLVKLEETRLLKWTIPMDSFNQSALVTHSRQFQVSLKYLQLLGLKLAPLGHTVGWVSGSLGDGIIHQKSAFNPAEGGSGWLRWGTRELLWRCGACVLAPGFVPGIL